MLSLNDPQNLRGMIMDIYNLSNIRAGIAIDDLKFEGGGPRNYSHMKCNGDTILDPTMWQTLVERDLIGI